ALASASRSAAGRRAADPRRAAAGAARRARVAGARAARSRPDLSPPVGALARRIARSRGPCNERLVVAPRHRSRAAAALLPARDAVREAHGLGAARRVLRAEARL